MKYQFIVVIAALFINFTAIASESKDFEVELWPNGAPTENGLKGQVEELQRSKGHLSKVSEPTLHVFPAATPNGKAIICCPGGSYVFLSMKNEGMDMAKWMNKQGITFAVLKYRMPNGHKEVPLEDSRRAIKIMRDSAYQWGIDSNQIGIMGCSAGGHFAATLATMYGEKQYRPDFQILLYPVISMEHNITHKNSSKNLLGENPSNLDIEKYSLQNLVNKDTPRAFIALSCDDKVVNPINSIEYVDSLLTNHVSVSLHMYPSGGHGWGYCEDFFFKRNWTDELETWLRTF